MKLTEHQRNCPECGMRLYYASLKGLKVATKLNRICKVCSNTGERNPHFGKPCSDYSKEIVRRTHLGKIVSEETKEKMRLNVLGEKNPMFGLTGSLCPNFGRQCSDEHKQVLHQFKWGVPISQDHRDKISNGLKGRVQSPETRRKMRLSKINHIIKRNGSIAPRYNKTACQYFDQMEKSRGWDGLYATKNGEFYVSSLGYFVDYYEPHKNVVVEYDEPKHYNVDHTLKKRDVIRMTEIIEHLKCGFYRYNQLTGEFKQYA